MIELFKSPPPGVAVTTIEVVHDGDQYVNPADGSSRSRTRFHKVPTEDYNRQLRLIEQIAGRYSGRIF